MLNQKKTVTVSVSLKWMNARFWNKMLVVLLCDWLISHNHVFLIIIKIIWIMELIKLLYFHHSKQVHSFDDSLTSAHRNGVPIYLEQLLMNDESLDWAKSLFGQWFYNAWKPSLPRASIVWVINRYLKPLISGHWRFSMRDSIWLVARLSLSAGQTIAAVVWLHEQLGCQCCEISLHRRFLSIVFYYHRQMVNGANWRKL